MASIHISTFSKIPSYFTDIATVVCKVIDTTDAAWIRRCLRVNGSSMHLQFDGVRAEGEICPGSRLDDLLNSYLKKTWTNLYENNAATDDRTLVKNFEKFKLGITETEKEFEQVIKANRSFARTLGHISPNDKISALNFSYLNKRAEGLLSESKKHMKEGNLELALLCLTPLPDVGGEQAELFAELGSKFLDQKDLAQALTCAQKLKDLDTQKADACREILLKKMHPAVVSDPALQAQIWPFIQSEKYPEEEILLQQMSESFAKQGRFVDAYHILCLRIELDHQHHERSYLSVNALHLFDEIQRQILMQGNVKEAIKMAAFAKELSLTKAFTSDKATVASFVHNGALIVGWLQSQTPNVVLEKCKIPLEGNVKHTSPQLWTYVETQIKQCTLPALSSFAQQVRAAKVPL